MRILLFSDLHGDRDQLVRLLKQPADYYVAAGDLVSWARGLDAMGPVLEPLGQRALVLPGNHENESHIEAFCAKYGLAPLHGRSMGIGDGWTLAGLGHSNKTPFRTPGEYSEEELRDKLAPFRDLEGEKTILVCHCPPHDTALDESAPGKHFGSTAVGELIGHLQPAWFFCGHIHEAWGRKTILGRTQAVNVGRQGYLLEL